MRIYFPALVLATIWLVPSVRAQNARGQSNPMARDPAAVAAGQPLFVEKCSACHGPNGEGGHGPSLVQGHQVRRASDQQLFDAVRNGLPGTDMSGFPMSDDDTWRVVAFVRSLGAPAAAQPVAGDVKAGSDIFWGSVGCSNCHSIHGRGGALGPDLTNIAAIRRTDQIKDAILKPNEDIPDGYRAVEATRADGTKVKGVAKFENNYTLRVLDRTGRLHFLEKKKLSAVSFPENSLMPGNYGERLSDDELNNLLAFLSRQTLRKWEQE